MKKRTPRPQTLISWMLQYGKDVLTCAVHWQPATSSYLVSVVPNGIYEGAIVESMHTSVAALSRHAAVAGALRARGWKVVAYSDAMATAGRQRAAAA